MQHVGFQNVYVLIDGNIYDVSATERGERIAICHRRPLSLQSA